MAEGLFVDLIEKQGASEHFVVDSCGTAAYHVGELPDHRMRETAAKHKVVLPSRARKLDVSDFDTFDYIIAMDESNLQNIKTVLPSNQVRAQLFKMRDFDDIDKSGDVPDPYYGGMNGFEDVYQMLLRCNQNFITYLNKSNG